MTVKLLLLTLPFFLLNCQGNAQDDWVSPCPRLFLYESKRNETNKWYGTITLLTETELNGVWLRIAFDRTAKAIGNWFGEAVTTDYKEFLIKNRNKHLTAHVPERLRFYVEYDPSEPPPKLIWFRLNAKKICPEEDATEAPALFAVHESSNNSPGDSGSSSSGSQFLNAIPPSVPSKNIEDICGTVMEQPRPLITYGQETAEGQFPWHVALYHTKGLTQTYICGASLVSKLHVVTAAHCVTQKKSQRPVRPNNLLVYLGKQYLKRFANPGLQAREISEVIRHPEFNGKTFRNDIALLKLGVEADITDYVRPVCLWQDPPEINTVFEQLGSVVGWGYDETGSLSDQLKLAKMPVVSRETCIRSYPEFYPQFTSDTTFCAGFRNGTSVCSGDSGGGMVFPKADSNSKNSVWQLRGVVSINIAFESRSCDTSYYVVFTDAAKYLEWIRKTIK